VLSPRDSMCAVIDAIMSYFGPASTSKHVEFVLVLLIRSKLLTHEVLVSWVFERDASELCQWWPWALLKNLALEAKVDVEDAVRAKAALEEQEEEEEGKQESDKGVQGKD
jgi:hypothetical protein